MQLDQPLASSHSPEDRIDDLCDRFEAAWRRGERPPIAAFLDRIDQPHRPALFYELLLVEIEYRRGERPSRGEYLARYPQFAEQIEAVDLKHGWGLVGDATLTAEHDTARVVTHAPGDRIAHFELRAWLGAGGMGEVWKAWDTRLHRPVAIKLPRARQLREADLHRFLREARAAAQLQHPHLAGVHDVGRDGGQAYIVADYVDGQTLRRYLEKTNLTFPAVAELCADVAEALHHAHEHGVVHRDLKPANILIDPDGHPHVIDFGLAKWSSDETELTLQGELLGTPAYMAPEQARGESDRVGRQTDVYALGAILYESLTGQCPFSGDGASVIHAIVTREPPAPRTIRKRIPCDLETICLKALEKEPARRYPTAQEMAVDLRRFARGEPILARRAGRLERTWRWLRRRPAVAAALLLMMLLMVTGAAIATLMQENYALQGYRSVRVTTDPPGARVAFVPLDGRTGELDPNPRGIIRPQELTPLTTKLKPGRYFIEAVLPGTDPPDFVEVYYTIYEDSQGRLFNLAEIRIRPTADIVTDMVPVPISDEARRVDPFLPEVLYVDSIPVSPDGPRVPPLVETDEIDPFDGISFDAAIRRTHALCKRLPSAAEYDAIIAYVRARQSSHATSDQAASIEGLFDGFPEWTTTAYHLRNPHGDTSPTLRRAFEDYFVLKGYGDPDRFPERIRTPDGKLLGSRHELAPMIGLRGVRSAAPRFLAD